MSSINFASVIQKAREYMDTPQMKKKTEEIKDSVMLGEAGIRNNNGSPPVHSAIEAASLFGSELRQTIQSSGMPPNVIAALEDYDFGSPYKLADGKYLIIVTFEDNTERSTMSTKKQYYTIDLAELYNDGVDHIMPQIFEREEDGKLRVSNTDIRGEHFLESTVMNFLGNYGSEYNVVDIKIDRVNM